MIDLAMLQKLAGVALPLVKQFGGSNPKVASLANVVGGLLGENPAAAPIKQEMDAALKDAVAARRAESQAARDELKFKPPGS